MYCHYFFNKTTFFSYIVEDLHRKPRYFDKICRITYKQVQKTKKLRCSSTVPVPYCNQSL